MATKTTTAATASSSLLRQCSVHPEYAEHALLAKNHVIAPSSATAPQQVGVGALVAGRSGSVGMDMSSGMYRRTQLLHGNPFLALIGGFVLREAKQQIKSTQTVRNMTKTSVGAQNKIAGTVGSLLSATASEVGKDVSSFTQRFREAYNEELSKQRGEAERRVEEERKKKEKKVEDGKGGEDKGK